MHRLEGEDFAGVPGTLARRGIANTAVLTQVCDDQGNSYEVVLQLQAGESSTQGDGILVHYTSNGRNGTVALPDRVVMCVRPERPECAWLVTAPEALTQCTVMPLSGHADVRAGDRAHP
jgi:hypothetical protein